MVFLIFILNGKISLSCFILFILFFYPNKNLWAIEMLQENKSITKEIDFKNQPDEFYKKQLNPATYNVCRRQDTERPGSGQYDKFYKKGTYYCACCGGDHALYSSDTKYDSGTGWPSFWAPYNDKSVTLTKESLSFLGDRVEVSCGRCASHLGHVFDDGPQEHTGKRYCMNSVALTFVPEGKKPQSSFLSNVK